MYRVSVAYFVLRGKVALLSSWINNYLLWVTRFMRDYRLDVIRTNVEVAVCIYEMGVKNPLDTHT